MTMRPSRPAQFFVARGFAVLAPMRRGRGASEGAHEEYEGTCAADVLGAGFARAIEDVDAAMAYLRLQPWAILTGTLVDTNGRPMAGVELAVTMQNDWQRGEPLVNSQGRVVTDAQGAFRFVDVPPRRLEVQRVIPFVSTGGQVVHRGWTYQMQTWLVAQPGTNNLGSVTYDQPPPAPMFEQIKKSIGL